MNEEIETMLSHIHTHAELCSPDEVVYKHSDIVELIDDLMDRYSINRTI